MTRIFAVTLLILASVAAARAQEAVLDVSDLVAPGHHRPLLRRGDWLWRSWVPAVDGMSTQSLLGEYSHIGISPDLGFSVDEVEQSIGRGELQDLAATWLDLGDEVRVEDGYLYCPASRAEELQKLLQWMRRSRQADCQVRFRMERIDGAEPVVLLAGDEPVGAGQTSVVSDVAWSTSAWDYSVEIAQSSVVANPVSTRRAAGTALAIGLRMAPDRSLALVRVLARVVEHQVGGTITLGHEAYGDLPRLVQRCSDVGFHVPVRPGEPVVTEWVDETGRRLRLTLEASWAGLPEARGTGVLLERDLAFLPITEWGAHSHNGATIYSVNGEDTDSELDEQLSSGLADLVESLLEAAAQRRVRVLQPESAVAPMVLVGPGADRVAEQVADAVARRLAPCEVDVEIVEVPSSTEPGSESESGELVLAGFRARIAAGLSAVFCGEELRSLLRDWDVEVAQAARIPEPKIDLLTTGCVGQVRVHVGPQGRPRSLELVADISKFDGMEAHEQRLSAAVIAPEIFNAWADGPFREGRQPRISVDRVPPQRMPADLVRIEYPTVRTHRLNLHLPLDENGEAFVRRTARSLTGPGRELVIRVRARAVD